MIQNLGYKSRATHGKVMERVNCIGVELIGKGKMNRITIKDPKGKKDTITLLSEKVLITLREYFKGISLRSIYLKVNLVEYATKSIQLIFKEACRKTRIALLLIY